MYCSRAGGEKQTQNNVLYAIICTSKEQTYLWMLYLCRMLLKEYSRNVIVSSGRETQGLIWQKQEKVAFGWLYLKAFFVAFKIMDKLFKESESVPVHLSFLWAPCLCLRSWDFLKRDLWGGVSSRGGGSFWNIPSLCSWGHINILKVSKWGQQRQKEVTGTSAMVVHNWKWCFVHEPQAAEYMNHSAGLVFEDATNSLTSLWARQFIWAFPDPKS